MTRWLILLAAVVAPTLGWAAAPVVDQSMRSGSSSGSSNGALRTGPAAAETVSLRKQLAEQTMEIEQLRNEIRELRGQLETQTHELESLKNRNREAMADADKRLRELERRSAPAASAAPAAAEAPARASNTTPPTEAEQKEYDAAFALMKEGYYEKASKGFRDFVTKYPSSELAGNAQYWVGEAFYVIHNFKQALVEFSKVTEKYPQSAKVPDALLKIAYCQQELGNPEKAREALQQVISRFPNTTTAKSAERRLADMRAAESKAKPKTNTKSTGTRR